MSPLVGPGSTETIPVTSRRERLMVPLGGPWHQLPHTTLVMAWPSGPRRTTGSPGLLQGATPWLGFRASTITVPSSEICAPGLPCNEQAVDPALVSVTVVPREPAAAPHGSATATRLSGWQIGTPASSDGSGVGLGVGDELVVDDPTPFGLGAAGWIKISATTAAAAPAAIAVPTPTTLRSMRPRSERRSTARASMILAGNRTYRPPRSRGPGSPRTRSTRS